MDLWESTFQPDQVQSWFRPPPRSLGCLDGRDGEGGLTVAADVGQAQLLGGGMHRTQAKLGHSASTVTWIPKCQPVWPLTPPLLFLLTSLLHSVTRASAASGCITCDTDLELDVSHYLWYVSNRDHYVYITASQNKFCICHYVSCYLISPKAIDRQTFCGKNIQHR